MKRTKRAVWIIVLVLVAGGCGDIAGPEQIAESFMEARDTWDAEATEALLAPDAVIDDLEVPRAADYSEQYRWYEAVEWRWALDECTESGSGTPATVSCSYNMENAWSRALDVGPIAGNMRFAIDDGQIVRVSHNGFNLGQFGSVWGSFRSWVRDNHPDEFNSIYSSGGNTPVYTAEAADLWKQLTDEFVAVTTGS